MLPGPGRRSVAPRFPGKRDAIGQHVLGPPLEGLAAVGADHAGDGHRDRLGASESPGRRRTRHAVAGERSRGAAAHDGPPVIPAVSGLTPGERAAPTGDTGDVPEGDTVWLAAQRMNTALAGATLRRGEFRIPQLADRRPRRRHGPGGRPPRQAPADPPRPTAARCARTSGWTAAGTSTGRARSGAAGPAYDIRVVLATDEWECVGYRLHDIELVPTADEDRLVGHLGPDVLGPDWDLDEALRRLRAHPDEQVGVAILDQRNLAGIGNLYKVESLFVRGVHPWARVADVADLAGPGRAGAHPDAGQPATTPSRTPPAIPRRGRDHWVFGRRGKPCCRCRTAILLGEQGPPTQERVTWWCPTLPGGDRPRSTRRRRTGEPGRPQPVTCSTAELGPPTQKVSWPEEERRPVASSSIAARAGRRRRGSRSSPRAAPRA